MPPVVQAPGCPNFLGVLYFFLIGHLVEIHADVGTCPWWVSTHRCCVRTNTSDLNKTHILGNGTTTCHGNLHSSGRLRRMRAFLIQSEFRVRAWQLRSSTKQLPHKYRIWVRTGVIRQSVSQSCLTEHQLHQAVTNISQPCVGCSWVFYLEVSAVLSSAKTKTAKGRLNVG